MGEQAELLVDLDRKISFGNELGKKLDPIIKIDGAYKIRKKIQQEVSFLKKVVPCCLTIRFVLLNYDEILLFTVEIASVVESGEERTTFLL